MLCISESQSIPNALLLSSTSIWLIVHRRFSKFTICIQHYNATRLAKHL